MKHAYGKATDIPDKLRALVARDAKVRSQARWDLEGALAHQGTRFKPTAFAVPFVIEALDVRHVERAETLDLLCHLANGDDSGWWVDGHPPGGKGSAIKGFGKTAYTAVLRGVPRYMEALQDPDANVRCSAAHLLAWLGTETKKTHKPMAARVAVEDDETALASAILALGYLGDDGDVPALRKRLSDGRARVSNAAAVALLHLDAVDRPVLDRLEAIVAGAPRRLHAWDLVPLELNRAIFGWPVPPLNDTFVWGALDAIVSAHMPRLEASHPRDVLAMRVAIRAGGSLAGDEAGRQALESLAAPDVDPVVKQRLLTLYATREDIWTKEPGEQLAALGLPDRPWTLRASLGLPLREQDRPRMILGVSQTPKAALEAALVDGTTAALVDDLSQHPLDEAWAISLAWTDVYPAPEGFREQVADKLSATDGIEDIVERDAESWLRAGTCPAVVTDDGYQSVRIGVAQLAVAVGVALAARGTMPRRWLEATGMLVTTDSAETALKALEVIPLERRVPVVESTVRASFIGDRLRFLQLAPTREIAERVLDLWARTPATSNQRLIDLIALAGSHAPARIAAILKDKAVLAATRKLFAAANKQITTG